MPNIDWKKLGFGFSDVNCHIRYTWKDGTWDKGELVKEPYITMHIGAACLHYGQEAFEGLKVFTQKNGAIAAFRPEANAERMFKTAQRTVMPPVPVPMFLEALDRVVKANKEFVPPYGTGGSMYVWSEKKAILIRDYATIMLKGKRPNEWRRIRARNIIGDELRLQ